MKYPRDPRPVDKCWSCGHMRFSHEREGPRECRLRGCPCPAFDGLDT